MEKGFLPICKEDMLERGWQQLDFVYVTGDAYVDHPSFGHAIITRILEANGYKVGIISQPDWKNKESIAIYGEPRLGFLVSSGNMDSMVNHYSVSKKRRQNDAFTPGGEMGKRPDYATTVYCNLIRQTYKKTPIIIGGIAIAAIYLFSAFGISAAIPFEEIGMASGLTDAFIILLNTETGPFIILVAFLFLLTLFGNMISWSLGVNNTACYAAEQGALPAVFAKRSAKNDMPIGSAIMNGIVATVIVILGIFLGESDLFWAFFALNLVSFLSSYIMMFPSFLKLRKEDVRLWRYIRNFSKEHSDVIIEPMEVSYDDIQAGNIHTTIKRVEETADTEFERQRNDTIEAHSPTIEEFVKVCGVSSVIEGGVSAGVEFIHKIKAGKKLSEFTKADAKDIFKQFAIGSSKGAIRGGVVYVMTNVFKFSATLISGTVTAAFGIVREGYLYLKNKITKEEFIKNSSFVVGETAFSTFGAVVGKKLCKRYPVIGTLVGSIVGSFGFGCMRRTVFA